MCYIYDDSATATVTHNFTNTNAFTGAFFVVRIVKSGTSNSVTVNVQNNGVGMFQIGPKEYDSSFSLSNSYDVTYCLSYDVVYGGWELLWKTNNKFAGI